MNNKGFTVVELIITFVIVMTISIGLFATVDAYRDKQQKELYRKDVNSYRNQILKVVQDDILSNGGIIQIIGIDTINGVCSGYDQGIQITFRDSTNKNLCIGNGNSGEATNGILYSDILYKKPSKFVSFMNDIIFEVSDVKEFSGDINLKKKFWSINIRIKHSELKEDFNINIVSPQILG